MKDTWHTIIHELEAHNVAALVVIAILLGLVVFVVIQVFRDIELITLPVASALTAVLGIPSLLVALLKWRKEKASEHSNSSDT